MVEIENLYEVFSFLVKNRLAFEFKNGWIYILACMEPKILIVLCEKYDAYYNGEHLVINACEVTKKILEVKS